MAIKQHTVFSDVYTVFYNLLNKFIIDPSSRGKQWIFSSFPEEDIVTKDLKKKVNYPILIIEPANMSWEQFTQAKVWNMIEITFEAYSTMSIQADSLLNQINGTIDGQRWNLKVDEGLDFLNLIGTDTDFTLRGGTRAHVRSATYTMRNAFRSGLAKLLRSNTINSNAEIS